MSNEWNLNDDTTWEEFFGISQDLMPSVMGAFDAIITNRLNEKDCDPYRKRSHNFHNLSPNVQKILSNVPDEEISRKFSSEECLNKRLILHKNLRTSDRFLQKSTENLDIISPNIQKMLSNLPDAEVLLTPHNRKVCRNNSYLHDRKVNNCGAEVKEELSDDLSERLSGCGDVVVDKSTENSYNQPLGSFLHTSPNGIASRTPVGRKNIGKFLQVPSEGTTISTASSSEVSRPVSLTSLGSCSSSGSSNGHHLPGSAYLASAESLDSDPEPNGSQVSGSADSGIAEQLPMSTEMRVLQEVLDTETVYVEDLNEVIQGYLQPWKADPECPLAQHIQHLFSNIEEIYSFNKKFLNGLREADCDPTKTANVFLQNDSGFTVYNEYCTNYPRTMDVLGKLTRDEALAALCREKQTQLNHALPLGSYLLKPVQRILKYHLLLQRLSKQCEPAHKAVVDLALATMTGIASNINNMKRKHEDAVRVQEIQSQLYGWNGPDLTALGELIAEGSFRVMGARGRRHVFLFEKILLFAKNKQDGALAYKSHIMCSNLMLVEQVRGEPLAFQVLPFDNPRLQSTLRARSAQHKREWTLQIKRVILENYKVEIPSHAKQLVMELGKDLQDTNDFNDKWSPLKLNSTPHYLERRSRVRKTRDLSNRRASSQDRAFPLGNWRRKSEPNMPHINAAESHKAKVKKAKESNKSTFYTDLSDSENGDNVDESMESLAQIEDEDETGEKYEDDTGKIVSAILMHKWPQNRPRKSINSDPTTPGAWLEHNNIALQMPKADSLPRSFQLNDQIGEKTENKDDSVSSKRNVSTDVEEHQENEFSSHDDHSCPEHKIYRKTMIRQSFLYRLRQSILSDVSRSSKFPIYKQGSKSMGEKIANPDYVDPQKFFKSSRSTVSLDQTDHNDLMGQREELDMTINEDDVLSELDKRLSVSTNNSDEQSSPNNNRNSENKHGSSQNSVDNCYYERLLDSSLKEEYHQDQNGRLVVKQDSFNSDSRYVFVKRSFEEKHTKLIRRPTNAPPPIPVKPSHLSSGARPVLKVTSEQNACNSYLYRNNSNASRVKEMVLKFQ